VTAQPTAVILHGVTAPDPAPEDADVFDQIALVEDALRALGYANHVQAVGLDLSVLSGLSGDIVAVNLVEGLAGQDRLIALVPAVLEALGVPFTGSGSIALALSNDKLAAKRLMAAAGIPTPMVLAGGAAPGEGRWIVKSVSEHGSKGLDAASVVAGCAVGEKLAERQRAYGGHWFAERFIDGREFNLSLLDSLDGPRVLPVAEMAFVDFPAGRARIVDYGAKWDPADPAYHRTERRFLPPADPLHARLETLALACWRCFGLSGYARVDFRVDDTGNPFVLEVNANPCLAPDAGFMAAAAQAGLTPDSVVGTLLEAALVPHS